MSQPPAYDPGSATNRDLDPHHTLPAPYGSDATETDPARLLPAWAQQPRPKGSWVRKIVLLLIILGIIGIVVWRIQASKAETAATANKAAQAANRPTPVQTTAVQMKTVPVYLTALGTVTAYNTVTLHSRVDGQLLKVNFQEGQTVKEGQLLLQIDPRPYQAVVDQAVGTLTKDEANLKNTEAEAQRYTALYQAGVVSKESQQTQISNAGQAAGSIKSDQAAIEAAKVNLSYTSIYSPINGVVGLRAVDPGNIVHASDSTGLVVITQIHPIAIIFTLPEDQLPQVQQAMRGGKKLVVEAYDRNDAHKIASGTLLTIDNQIDTTTGTAKLKAVFDNADGSLFPNQFVNVRLITQERENAIVVPTAAIQTGTQGTFVFVVHDGPGKEAAGSGGAGGSGKHRGGGTASATPDETASAGSAKGGKSKSDGGPPPGPPKHANTVNVTVDFTQGSNSILSPGAVNAGDQVIVDGQEKLTDGSNVTPQAAVSGAGKSGRGIGASAATGALGPGSNTGAPAGGGNRP
ncbi:MAG TPA: efflux RND transporter periplasmic adaptor subunit [Acidobacteriaceae bacterium]|nr:efflux RND transporter periplasmic adaptor subunit [Acidobacteriaceae bacterium]